MHTYGLISAFFDDHDEPLTICTLLFDDEESHEIFRVLSSDSFDMFFFDEHNRELIGFRAENPDAARFQSLANTIRLVPGTLEIARQFHDDMMFWFGARSTADDNAALRINLFETQLADNLYPQSQTPGDSMHVTLRLGCIGRLVVTKSTGIQCEQKRGESSWTCLWPLRRLCC